MVTRAVCEWRLTRGSVPLRCFQVRGLCTDLSNVDIFDTVNVRGNIRFSDIHHNYFGMWVAGRGLRIGSSPGGRGRRLFALPSVGQSRCDRVVLSGVRFPPWGVYGGDGMLPRVGRYCFGLASHLWS